MQKNKSLKTRVNDLENQEPEESPKIVIDWGDSPKPKPGDILIIWDDDDNIRAEIVKDDSN